MSDAQSIEGVYVANVTPFREGSLEIDVAAYLAHVEWLAERGVRGIVPFGTNGEGPSTTSREKLGVLEDLFNRDPEVQVIPTVMEGNLPETLELLQALEGYPATAVLVLPPYYFKPAEAEGLTRFYERVLEATSHPMIVYHIPKYAIPVPTEVVAGLPVWGVKDSGGDHEYAKAVLGSGKGVLLGTEDNLWEKLKLGAEGTISALANFMPEDVVSIWEAAKAGNEQDGKALSEKLQRMRGVTKEYASPAVLKRLAQARHGASMGTVRPPFLPLPEDYDPSRALEAVSSAR